MAPHLVRGGGGGGRGAQENNWKKTCEILGSEDVP